VRRAVALAIDREAYRQAVFPEGAEPFAGPIPIASPYALPLDKLGAAARYYRQDLAAARALLAEAGYPNGFSTKLYTTSGYGPEYVSRTELLKDMLSKIGIEASIVTQEYPVWISRTYKGVFEGMVHIPAWTLGDEDEWLATYTPGDTRNQIHVNDPELTDLIRRAREAPDEAARARLIGQFVRTFHDQLFRVFLPQPVVLSAVSSRVKGYVPMTRGYSYPTALVNVWMD
jgi:ABC-type transport system substrate-binding protein